MDTFNRIPMGDQATFTGLFAILSGVLMELVYMGIILPGSVSTMSSALK